MKQNTYYGLVYWVMTSCKVAGGYHVSEGNYVSIFNNEFLLNVCTYYFHSNSKEHVNKLALKMISILREL